MAQAIGPFVAQAAYEEGKKVIRDVFKRVQRDARKIWNLQHEQAKRRQERFAYNRPILANPPFRPNRQNLVPYGINRHHRTKSRINKARYRAALSVLAKRSKANPYRLRRSYSRSRNYHSPHRWQKRSYRKYYRRY